MKNLVTLYKEDGDFREAAIDYAADLIGTTSYDFAREWLEMGCEGDSSSEKPVSERVGSLEDENTSLKSMLDKAHEVIAVKDEVIFALTDEVKGLREQIATASKVLAYEREA